MDAEKKKQEMFELIMADMKEAFIDHYGREPNEAEARALRKMVVLEVALYLVAMTAKMSELMKGDSDETIENHAHHEA